MDIFSMVITLVGGLAFFLYGMTVMSGGLEKMTGGKLEKALNSLTSNPFKGILLGMGITIAIQSSSALTVMLVGLVNSGVMQFSQTVSVIMGSNIGTTLTAWLLSLVGLEDGGNIFIRLLKPTSFSPILAFIGILMIMTSKRTSRKDMGSILVGFAVLMFGMSLMSDAMEPLSKSEQFASILTMFQNPLLGILVGTVFTGIIQSSAASVAILQSLSVTGGITYGMAIPIIMGQNIGTCVTSLISSIGVSKNAKRVAVLHISFNIIGTVAILIIYSVVDAIVELAILDTPIDAFGIAVVHSIFNVATTLMLLPFRKLLIKLAEKIVRGDDIKTNVPIIDERLLKTPSFAIAECNASTASMAKYTVKGIRSAISLMNNFDSKLANEIYENEEMIDKYEDQLGTYLVKLSAEDLSVTDSRQIAKLLHTIGDFERIGDHAVNITDAVIEMRDKKISFSDEAIDDIKILRFAIDEIVDLTFRAFTENNLSTATDIEPLEERIDDLILDIKTRHISRLQAGACTIELGFILSDFLTNFERISDHCSNIAVAIIEVSGDVGIHQYLGDVKSGKNEHFIEKYEMYKNKYSL
ncbi:MAG: Na/Pi cotransporter family protein [Clostridia bacterium]|nr:Na/Pi cotransporter family protein [Clostridia bacterium]